MALKEGYRFTDRDLAKYPFLREVARYLEEAGFTVKDMEAEYFQPIVDRAYSRIVEAMERGVVSLKLDEPRLEIASFPVAVLLVRFIGDEFLARRYALAESLRARELLEGEPKPLIEAIASRLGFKAEIYDGYAKLYFTDYLKYASRFHDPRWKIVNRILDHGWILLSRRELIRLISEAIQDNLFKILSRPLPGDAKPPFTFEAKIIAITGMLSDRKAKYGGWVDVGFVEDALPPCVKAMYTALKSGRHLPHIARFTLASFLLNIGLTVDDVVKLFVSIPDADERITRYQVEHIAGMRGSMTKYTSPSCSTLKTHGLCVEDESCKGVKHPLIRYKRSVRRAIGGGGGDGGKLREA